MSIPFKVSTPLRNLPLQMSLMSEGAVGASAGKSAACSNVEVGHGKVSGVTIARGGLELTPPFGQSEYSRSRASWTEAVLGNFKGPISPCVCRKRMSWSTIERSCLAGQVLLERWNEAQPSGKTVQNGKKVCPGYLCC